MTLKPRGYIKRKPKKKEREKKKKEPPISQLIKKADQLFSIKVRRMGFDEVATTDLDGNEVNQCYTCLGIFLVKRLHCGHYLSRFYKAARWDYDNARPQCMMCNLWKRGDPITFRQNLIREIGEERVLAVEAKRSVHTKLTREFLTALIQSLQ